MIDRRERRAEDATELIIRFLETVPRGPVGRIPPMREGRTIEQIRSALRVRVPAAAGRGEPNEAYAALVAALREEIGATPVQVDSLLLRLGMLRAADARGRIVAMPLTVVNLAGPDLRRFVLATVRAAVYDELGEIPRPVGSAGELASVFPDVWRRLNEHFATGGTMESLRTLDPTEYQANAAVYSLFAAQLTDLDVDVRSEIGTDPVLTAEEAEHLLRSRQPTRWVNYPRIGALADPALHAFWVSVTEDFFTRYQQEDGEIEELDAEAAGMTRAFLVLTSAIPTYVMALQHFLNGRDHQAAQTLLWDYYEASAQPFQLLEDMVRGHSANFIGLVGFLSPTPVRTHVQQALAHLATFKNADYPPLTLPTIFPATSPTTWLEDRKWREVVNMTATLTRHLNGDERMADPDDARQVAIHHLVGPPGIEFPRMLAPLILRSFREGVYRVFGVLPNVPPGLPRPFEGPVRRVAPEIRGEEEEERQVVRVGVRGEERVEVRERLRDVAPRIILPHTEDEAAIRLLEQYRAWAEQVLSLVGSTERYQLSLPVQAVYRRLEEGERLPRRRFPDSFRVTVENQLTLEATIDANLGEGEDGGEEFALKEVTVLNVMAAVRECCFRVSKMHSWVHLMNLPAPTFTQIIVRLGIEMHSEGWPEVGWVTVVQSWRIIGFADERAWVESVTRLTSEIWRKLQVQLLMEASTRIFHGYDDWAGSQWRVGSVTARSDYMEVMVLKLGQRWGSDDQHLRGLAYAYWFSGQRRARKLANWYVMADGDEYAHPQFAGWVSTEIVPPYFTRPCLYFLAAYFLRSQTSRFADLINHGAVYEIVEVIRRVAGIRLGIYRAASWEFSTIVEGEMHVWASPTHVTLMGWSRTKSLLDNKLRGKNVSGGSHMTASRYVNDPTVRELSLRSATPEVSRVDPIEYDIMDDDVTLAPSAIKLFYDREGNTVSRRFRRNQIFWDIECLAKKEEAQFCYLSVMVGWFGDRWVECVHCADTPLDDVIAQWVEQLFAWEVELSRSGSKQPLRIWTYNGFKYELKFALTALTQKFGVIHSLGRGASTKGLGIGEHLQLMDARCLYPSGSLDTNAAEFNLHYRKKDVEISKVEHFFQWDKKKEDIVTYCYADCLATFELVERWYLGAVTVGQAYLHQLEMERRRGSVFRPSQKLEQIPITALLKLYTCPQLAVAFFNWYFVGDVVLDNNEPPEVTKLQRENYSGGLTEVYKHLVDERVFDVDVNSMYPNAMTKPLPWTYVRHHKLSSHESDAHMVATLAGERELWFFHVVRVTVGWISSVGSKTDKGTVYPKSLEDKWVWGCELRPLRAEFVQVDEAHEYVSTHKAFGGAEVTCAADYVRFLYEMKKSCGRDEKGKKLIVKLLLNSLYGKWGQRKFTKHSYIQTDHYDAMDIGFDSFPATKLGQFYHVERGGNRGAQMGDNVRLASFVCAFSRGYIVEGAHIAGEGNVYYADTDSLFVNEAGYDNLRAAGLCDEVEEVLGNFKLESFRGKPAIFERGVFVSRKCYSLVNKNGVLFKAKGVNWEVGKVATDVQKLEHTDLLVEKVREVCARAPNEPYKPTYELGVRMPSNRWVWSEDFDSVVIQEYQKNINMNPKRVICDSNKTDPLDRIQLKHFNHHRP